jgi:hypothetical protein
VIGLLAGAMLFIAVALMPFWQQLPPAEFRAWFAAHSGRIAELMFSLGIAAVLLSLSALIRDGRNLLHWIAFGAAPWQSQSLRLRSMNRPMSALPLQ